MKDALGHGSDARGIAHQTGTQRKAGRTFGAMMRDQSGAGKMFPGAEHALDKVHDPAMLAHLASEMHSPEMAVLAHLAHIFL